MQNECKMCINRRWRRQPHKRTVVVFVLMSHMSGSVVIPSRARANVIIPCSFPKQGRRIKMSLLFHFNRDTDSVIQLDLANLAVFRSLPSAGSPTANAETQSAAITATSLRCRADTRMCRRNAAAAHWFGISAIGLWQFSKITFSKVNSTSIRWWLWWRWEQSPTVTLSNNAVILNQYKWMVMK